MVEGGRSGPLSACVEMVADNGRSSAWVKDEHDSDRSVSVDVSAKDSCSACVDIDSEKGVNCVDIVAESGLISA